MGKLDSRGAVTAERRPKTEDHPTGLEEADFIVGLPGETRESIRKTIDFAKRLDTETIQVSIAHPYPGTEFYDYAKKNNSSGSNGGAAKSDSAKSEGSSGSSS